jgi:hypothetical protein
MTQDESEEFINTLRFLDDRLEDVGTLGRTINDVSSMLSFGASQLSNVLSSKGIKL